jgi:Fic family protein
MDQSALYDNIAELLRDDTTTALLREMSAHYVSWDTFAQVHAPDGVNPAAAWTVLKSMSRALGLEIPIPDHGGTSYWYTRTHELSDAAAKIHCLCRTDSSLHASLMETHNRRVLVESRLRETVAAAMLDGLVVDSESARASLHLDRKPRTPADRLLRNTLTTMDQLDHLVDTPFSQSLFETLREMLLSGVNVDELERTQSRMGVVTREYSDDEVRQHARDQLRYICDYYNHTTGATHDHVVMRALLLPDVLHLYRPLADLNSEVGRLAFRLYTLKIGLPVLGWLPLSSAKLTWEDGKLESPLITMTREQYLRARKHDGPDITSYTTISVQLALVALQDLREKLYRLEQRDKELRALLQTDVELNHRQRSILGRALRNPQAEFRISHHKATHNIVYATARSDLLGLVEKGYLDVNMRGREMVFRPQVGLQARLSEHIGSNINLR